jgi:hypothetical protein
MNDTSASMNRALPDRVGSAIEEELAVSDCIRRNFKIEVCVIRVAKRLKVCAFSEIVNFSSMVGSLVNSGV